jgi:hypothetical protein
MLLLAILLVLNLLTFVNWKEFNRPWRAHGVVNAPHDWTKTSIYSLSDKSVKILESLDRPLKIYAVLLGKDPLYDRVRALLDNVAAASRQVEVEFLSPDLNQKEVENLARKYGFTNERQGLLLVYGTGDRAVSQFIKRDELIEARSMGMEQQARAFNGELALLTAINFLVEGKEKGVLYFTQGNGEMDLRDTKPNADRGLGTLKQRLERYYQVKGLHLVAEDPAKPDEPDTVTAKRVPDDAAVVVVAGVRRNFPQFAADALKAYMDPPPEKDPKAEKDAPPKSKKKGTLIVLLDLAFSPDGTRVEPTGLEGLLADYNVRAGADIILHDPRIDGFQPHWIDLEVSAGAAANPVAAAFANQQFLMKMVRTVEPVPGGNRDARFQVDVLLEAPRELRAWSETDPQSQRIRPSGRAIPAAVMVSEGESLLPRDDFHSAARQREQKPRLVVFGSSYLAGNPRAEPLQSGGRYFDLFNSCVAWLRERPAGIGIEPKKSDIFMLSQNVNVARMSWLPGLLALFVIASLGTGVWLVRRR